MMIQQFVPLFCFYNKRSVKVSSKHMGQHTCIRTVVNFALQIFALWTVLIEQITYVKQGMGVLLHSHLLAFVVLFHYN